MKLIAFLSGLTIATAASALTPQSTAQLISSALTPLPAQLRNGATVVHFVPSPPHMETVRQGSNGITCIADNPVDDRLETMCYRDSFLPVLYRGFEVGEAQVEAEIKSGKLQLSRDPTAGYRCSGPIAGYDAATGKTDSTIECWQSIHNPYRTAAEIGVPDESELPEDQQKDIPYVMSGGTYWSHVMLRHS